MSAPRPFADLRPTGLLWAINKHLLHPRGFALALTYDDNTHELVGWELFGDGAEPWQFDDDEPEATAFAEFLAHGGTP